MRIPLPPAFLDRPIAHRALHDIAAGRPENSRAAARAAIAGGFGIEIDLHLSRDGVAMVFHDDDLDRLTGATGPLSARTAAELGSIPLRHGDEGIPTFAEMLALVAGQVPLLVEIKAQAPADGRLEQAVAAALEGYSGPVAVMSFEPASMAHMARHAPHVPRGLTTCAYAYDEWPELSHAECDTRREIPDYDAVAASFLSHEAADLARGRVSELQSEGAALLCWTIRSAEAEAEARRIAGNVTFEGYLPAPAAPH
ncbi:glycerophosphodiester phosphodiesterase family protein [Falsirhodobacter halotolerans]|uniref:glycerophosphodiester phosphodiesterase family protein n=1 Tax=Falsirhodobacter halotolerans TaxID=1146892 RepID=UPI001FD5CDB0|nr:glycerophosphodiester phosphodiesterase family protein [Falsirhodobacter halotolerans]MCJ8140663.1 phosphodiesterase [Falsirhodobacter halotolerans]